MLILMKTTVNGKTAAVLVERYGFQTAVAYILAATKPVVVKE